MKIKNLISTSRKFRDILGKDTVSGIKTVSDSDFDLNKVDMAFINKIVMVVENNYKISDFNIDVLCNQTGMSTTQLGRKMAALFNKTPNEFILRYRLYKAEKLMKEDGRPGSKAAYEVGFDNLSYFAKCYRAEFGGLPNKKLLWFLIISLRRLMFFCRPASYLELAYSVKNTFRLMKFRLDWSHSSSVYFLDLKYAHSDLSKSDLV